MEQQTGMVSIDEFLVLPDDGKILELILGRVESVPLHSFLHGVLSAKMIGLIGNQEEHHRHGRVLAKCGYILGRDPGTVIAPDLSFLSFARFPEEVETSVEYPEVAPDLAVEIVDKWDRASHLEIKRITYLQHGTRMVLMVWPESGTVSISLPDLSSTTYSGDDIFTLEPVLPGFRQSVSELLTVSR